MRQGESEAAKGGFISPYTRWAHTHQTFPQRSPPSGPPGEFDGVGLGGKVCFMDLADRTMAQIGTVVPPSTAAELYDPGFNAGARVSSNSWGAGFPGGQLNGQYTARNRDTDAYLYAHPELLSIFAAGTAFTAGIQNPGGESRHSPPTPALLCPGSLDPC